MSAWSVPSLPPSSLPRTCTRALRKTLAPRKQLTAALGFSLFKKFKDTGKKKTDSILGCYLHVLKLTQTTEPAKQEIKVSNCMKKVYLPLVKNQHINRHFYALFTQLQLPLFHFSISDCMGLQLYRDYLASFNVVYFQRKKIIESSCESSLFLPHKY